MTLVKTEADNSLIVNHLNTTLSGFYATLSIPYKYATMIRDFFPHISKYIPSIPFNLVLPLQAHRISHAETFHAVS